MLRFAFLFLLVSCAAFAVAPAVASAATCNVASNGAWSTYDWSSACGEAGGYEPGSSDDLELADGVSLAVDEDVTIRDLTLGSGASLNGTGDVSAADVELGTNVTVALPGQVSFATLDLGSGSSVSINGSITSGDVTVPGATTLHLNGDLAVDLATIEAGGIIDLHGHELEFADGGLALSGTQDDGAATLMSTAAAGTVTIDNLGGSLSMIRGSITNVNIAVGGNVRFETPLDATGVVTNTLANAVIEITASGAALTASCAWDIILGDICHRIVVAGSGSSVVRIPGMLDTGLNAQLDLQVPLEIDVASATWNINPINTLAAPDAPTAGTSYIRLTSTPTRVGGGALSIAVDGPPDMTDAGLDIAVGDGFTAIAAPSIAPFSAGNAAADRVFLTDTTGSPHQFMIFRGPVPALTNTAAPVVSGSGSIGAALTTTAGAWSQSTGVTYAYQWYSKASGAGSFTAIAGATSSSYTPVVADASADVRVEVTARKVGYTQATMVSNSVLIAGMVVNTVAPTLSGEYARSGVPVGVASQGTWSETTGVTYTYQWYVDAAAPRKVGSDSSSYTPAIADGGLDIWAEVTASKPGFVSGTASTAKLRVRHALPTIDLSAPADKLVETLYNNLAFSIDAYGARVTSVSCSATNADTYCNNSAVSVKPTAVKDVTLTVVVTNSNGESVTKTVQLATRALALDDVFRGSKSTTVASGSAGGGRAMDWRLRDGWRISCAGLPDVFPGAGIMYSTFSPDGSYIVCNTDPPTYEGAWSVSTLATMSFVSAPLPGTYTFEVPIYSAATNRGFKFDYVITVKSTPGASTIRSGAMGSVVDASSPLRCGGLLIAKAVEADPKGTFMWFVDGKFLLVGKDYWELPLGKLPKSGSGTVTCLASGLGAAYSASVILDGGVRIGASLTARTVATTTQARLGRLGGPKGYASFALRLQTSGKKTVRITTYRLLAHKRGAKVTYRYHRAGTRFVTLKRGTRVLPVTARRASGYKLVVTAMHRKSRADARLVPGRSMTIVR